LGITDGEYSQILPLKEGEEVDLKVGDLVIIGIEGQTGVKTPATGGAARMF
jgi:HlyD family secretion protein